MIPPSEAEPLITRWFRWVLAHRGAVVAVLLLASVASAVSLSRAVVATSMVKLFLGDDPAYARYLELVPLFGGDEVVLVAYDSAGVLEPAELDRLARAVRAVEALPDVERVESVLSAQRVAQGGGLTTESYAELARGDPARIPALTAALVADPRAGGLVVSPDGRAGAVMVVLAHDAGRPAETGPGLVRAIEGAFLDAGFAPESLHLTGLVVLLSALIEATLDNILGLFPFTLAVMIVSVQLLLRRLLPVVISTGVALVAVLWTMGFSVALDPEVNIMVGLVPAVILIVAISDVVHLWSAYVLELEAGYGKEEAILRSASDVGAACLLTSVTTFVGFVSLAFIPTPIYRQLGVVLGFGVAVALALAITLMPILLSWLPAPSATERSPGVLDRALDAFVAWLAVVTVRRRRLILALTGLALIPMAVGMARFTVDSDPLERMSEGSRLRVDASWFHARFAGANLLEVFVTAPEDGGALDPALLGAVARLDAAVEALPEVDAVVSLPDALAQTHRALAPDLAEVAPIPQDEGVVAEYLFLYEVAGASGIEQLVDGDRRVLRLVARLPDQALRATSAVGQRVVELGQALLPAGTQVEASGLTALFGGFLDDLIAGQNRALGFSILSVAVLMILGLRSIPVGLWSMIPNVMPTVAVIGTLGLMYDKVDSDSLVAVLMAVGIGVDDTIHFLMRYRIEGRRYPKEVAIQRTFAFAGRAIILTTIILAAGFTPLAFSDYLSIRLLGILLPVALLVALAADLFLLPALTAMGWVRFRDPG